MGVPWEHMKAVVLLAGGMREHTLAQFMHTVLLYVGCAPLHSTITATNKIAKRWWTINLTLNTKNLEKVNLQNCQVNAVTNYIALR